MTRWPWFKRRPDTLRDTLDHLTTTVNFLVAENAQLRDDLAEVAAVVFGPCPQCAVDEGPDFDAGVSLADVNEFGDLLIEQFETEGSDD